MSSFKDTYGPWAIVTGASSGIGVEFARQLAAKGLNLILIARRKDRLDALAEELSGKHQITVKTLEVDLGASDFLEKVREGTDGLEVGLLVNNAGVAVNGPLHKPDLEKQLQMLHVNCTAPMVLAHEFANQMIARQKGGIIFTASVSSFFPVPYVGHYAATKAYGLFLAASLNYELRKDNIHVQAICPGYTESEMTEKVRAKKMSAQAVVEESLDKLGRKSVVIAGLKNKLMVWFMTKFFSTEALARLGGRMMEK